MPAIFTRATLRQAIADEARVGSDAKFVTVINDLIEELMIQAIIRDKPREYFRTNAALTPGSTEINLPADFLIPDRLIYTSGGQSWELMDESGPVSMALIAGKPASYSYAKDLVTGLSPILRIYPNGNVLDTLLLDYYYRPNFTADADQIIYERAVPSIKREGLQRLQILQNKPADQLAAVVQQSVTLSQQPLKSS